VLLNTNLITLCIFGRKKWRGTNKLKIQQFSIHGLITNAYSYTETDGEILDY
jgi:hypothetical protein